VPSPAVQFLQADAGWLPLRASVADRALSCQMLEHLPGAAARQRGVQQVARALRPGSTFVTSAYWYSPLNRLFGGKEGHHDGAIYFYRFTRAEFAELLGSAFDVQELTARLVYVLLARAVARQPDSRPGARVPKITHETSRA
jgi:SAM-dependent methyltransferase